MLRCAVCGLLSLLLFASFSARGEHAFKLTPVLGASVSNLSITSATPPNTEAGAGAVAGAFVAWGFGGPVYLETGLLASRRMINDLFGLNTSFAASYLEVPVLVRWEPIPYFSLAAGGYTAFAITDVTQTSGASKTTRTFEQLGFKSGDYGLTTSLRGAIPFNDRMAIILDVRYLLGLQQISKTTGIEARHRSLEFLGGVSFGF